LYFIYKILFVIEDVPLVITVPVNGIDRLISSSFDTWVIIDDKSISFDVLLIVKRIFEIEENEK
jgi:hypothetical protein